MRSKIVIVSILAVLFAASFFTPKKSQAVACCCNQEQTKCISSILPQGPLPPPQCDEDSEYNLAVNSPDASTCEEVVEKQSPFGWETLVSGKRTLIPPGCLKGEQKSSGDCGINELLQVFGNITKLILGIIGSVSLLMFMYAGFTMVISAGNSDKIQRAKSTLANAVFGIIIVFTSWVVVNFIVSSLTEEDISNITGPGKIFETESIQKPPKSEITK